MVLSQHNKIIFFILGLLSIFIKPKIAWAELTVAEINSIARQTTVLIAPGLTPNLREELEQNRNNPIGVKEGNKDSWQPGSGVIVVRTQGEKKAYKYYVLTVAHNFKQRYLDTKEYWQDSDGEPFYGIRTGDGEVHIVKPVNDQRSCKISDFQQPTLRGNLLRFGCSDRFLENKVYRGRGGERQVIGNDLAIITFESDKNYPVVLLGDSNEVEKGELVYVSGWPDPERQQDPNQQNQCHPKQGRRTRRLAWGPLIAKKYPYKYGYSLMYINMTTTGMSGGPVFDSQGHLIGIHGVAPYLEKQLGVDPQVLSQLESCDDGPTLLPVSVQSDDTWETQPDNNDWFQQQSDFDSQDVFQSEDREPTIQNWGESDLDINQFWSENQLESQSTSINPPSLTTTEVKKVSMAQDINDYLMLMNKSQLKFPFPLEQISTDIIKQGIVSLGKIKVTPSDERGKYIDDSQDVVEDIYKVFSSQTLIRDEASSGCKFLLIGDPCDKKDLRNPL